VSQAHILVVDNDPVITNVIAGYLVQLGYAVTQKKDLSDALHWLQTPGNRPDLVISDATISGKNDHELLRLIRADPGGIYPPIILLAEEDNIAEKIIGFKAGADDYLIKPVSTLELSLRIKAMLTRTQTWRPPRVPAQG
jgi:DNA-binding response OmpR family regulator